MAVSFLGCAEKPLEAEATSEQALTIEIRGAPPSSSTESSLTLRWSIGEGIVEYEPKASLEL